VVAYLRIAKTFSINHGIFNPLGSSSAAVTFAGSKPTFQAENEWQDYIITFFPSETSPHGRQRQVEIFPTFMKHVHSRGFYLPHYSV
jgi:hypothetical protein